MSPHARLASKIHSAHAFVTMKQHVTDIVVVGAGVIGLAVALAAARRGRRVTLFEREAIAVGASVRNFGLVIPFSQPPGALHDRAMRSREIWLELATAASLYHSPRGSLALAYHTDEQEVLEDYLLRNEGDKHGRRLLTQTEVREVSSIAKTDGLRAALYSPTEVVVDPREAIRRIPDYLSEQYGVEVHRSTAVHTAGTGHAETADGRWAAEEVFVCSGTEFHSLFPAHFAASGLEWVKLQMLRTKPQPEDCRPGPALCSGLTLTHYPAFGNCSGLPALQARFERDLPFHVDNGIHVLATQTRSGQITIGDSHHHADTVDPFDSEAVNQALLEYLRTFAQLPYMEIQERWHGVYAKHPTRSDVIVEPEPGVTIVNGLSGAGMTFAFGLAEELADSRNW